MEQLDQMVLTYSETLPARGKKQSQAPKDTEPCPVKGKKKPKRGIVGKAFAFIGTFLLLVIVAAIVACHVLLNGPSPTMRDALVLSAKQASATKWLPGLFLDEKLVQEIEENSKKVTYDVVSMEEIAKEPAEEAVDEWANAVDGIRLDIIQKPSFKAYMIVVKDPSRVFVGVSGSFPTEGPGMNIFKVADKYQATCVINGGEFPDVGGVGDGGMPIGITYSQGKLVYNGHTNRTFMGLTHDNRLVVSEGMTKKRAEELGIRDGVCFQTGNSLISNDGENVTLHYSDRNTGRAQRSAIGQRADGAMLLLVTDGRTASSLGATHNELIEIMLEYGATAAGKLDGGSSAMMYYRDFYNLYGIPESELDQYGRRGLVNTYKAFTEPRRLPTFWMVGGATE